MSHYTQVITVNVPVITQGVDIYGNVLFVITLSLSVKGWLFTYRRLCRESTLPFFWDFSLSWPPDC